MSTDIRSEDSSLEYISGFRSSGKTSATGKRVASCDKEISLVDPFDLSITRNDKLTKVREYYVTNSGKRKFRYKLVVLPHPRYEFKMKTRTVKEWKMVLLAGSRVVSAPQMPKSVASFWRHYRKLHRVISRYNCSATSAIRSAGVQHSVTHFKTTIQEPPVNSGQITWDYYGPKTLYSGFSDNAYGHRLLEFSHYFDSNGSLLTGTHGGMSINSRHYTKVNNARLHIEHTYFQDPFTELISSVPHLTAMLWPDTDDMTNIPRFNPLGTAAELAVDGFPLAQTPEVFEPAKDLLEHESAYNTINTVMDTAANAQLFTALVAVPLMMSGASMLTAISANDNIIESYQKIANRNLWIQGKSRRLYSRPTEKYNFDNIVTSTYFDSLANEVSPAGRWQAEFEIRMNEANASFYYRPSFKTSSELDTSAKRLGLFFNQMSISLESLMYNLIPFSFVMDWFSNHFSEQMELQDKVYLEIDDWKLTLSHKILSSCTMTEATTSLQAFYNPATYCKGLWYYNTEPAPRYVSWKRPSVNGHRNGIGTPPGLPPPYFLNFNYWYEYPTVSLYSENRPSPVHGNQETHDMYRRVVFERPLRSSDPVVPAFISESDIKPPNSSQALTGLALLWSFI